MIGDPVDHPQYGRGRILEVYRNGTEWLVRFDNGLRFRRPRDEFAGMGATPLPAHAVAFTHAPPMPHSQFEARRLLEALRVGVAPLSHVRELTIGLEAERASLAGGLNRALEQGGDARAVIGEYGFGKSHFVQLAAEEALARRFLVATVGLDIVELPAHKPFDIYAALMRSLRYPDHNERDLGGLLEAAATPQVAGQLRERAPVDNDPLAVALGVLADTGAVGRRRRNAWQEWLMGAKKVKGMAKALPRGTKMPVLYTIGNNERQIAYLLTAVSVLARLANYSGLAVLIDEAESYSLLRADQRAKAGTFFRAVIYTALGDAQARISLESLPQHRYSDYPPRFGPGQSLFFLFTLTHSDNQMPLEEWLDPSNILALNPHTSPQEIGQFLPLVQAYHARAFGYEPGERQAQVRRAATEFLADGARRNRLSIRGVVRLAVELFDLLYLYPDYDVPTLLDELRQQLR